MNGSFSWTVYLFCPTINARHALRELDESLASRTGLKAAAPETTSSPLLAALQPAVAVRKARRSCVRGEALIAARPVARVIEKNLERLPSRAPLATLIHKVGCGAGPRSTSSSQMISDCSEISRASPEIRPPAYLITSRPAVEAVSSDSATDTRATLRRSKRSGSSQIVDAGLCGPFPRASGPDRGAIILREIEPVDLFAKLHQYAIIRPALIAVSQQKSEIPPNTANVFCSRDDRVRVRCCRHAGRQFRVITFRRPKPIAGNLM